MGLVVVILPGERVMFKTKFSSDLFLHDELRYIKKNIVNYDISALESFRIHHLENKFGFYGINEYPTSIKKGHLSLIVGCRIRCGINSRIQYPITVNSEMDSTELSSLKQLPTEEPSLNDVTLESLSEMAIWISGLTFQRYLNRIEWRQEELLVESQIANQWLDSWRLESISDMKLLCSEN